MAAIASHPILAVGAVRLSFHAVGLAVALACVSIAPAWALPTGEQVVAGQVSVARPNPKNMVVNQGSANAIVNWQGFSIGSQEGVRFQQPSVSSVILNRVVTNNPSEIYGSLSANGRVFLINPSGVMFGPGASVSVGALVASTLGIGNEDFLAGRYRFSASGSTAGVINQGTLQAADRGTIALLGGQVRNDGTVTARLGTAALASGARISIDFAGDGLTRINVDEATVKAQVQNNGMVITDGGQAVLSARAAEALAGTVINQQGVVRARTLVEREGRIMLDGGETGQTLVSGNLDASGLESGRKGGEIQVLGHHVGVVDQASLDARGAAGGGTVLVGGDYQGKNPQVRNAQATFFGRDASINATATENGNGGKVIVWSNEATRAYGTISARGGEQGGDGGFIETSGTSLDIAGVRANAGAPKGKGGQWLLDPIDITIDGPTAAAIAGSLNGSTSVTVSTQGAGEDLGNIEVAASVIKSAGGSASLTLRADANINMQPGVEIRSSVGKLDITFDSAADGSGLGAIRMQNGSSIHTNGGDIVFGGGADPLTGSAGGFGGLQHGIFLDRAIIDTRAAGGASGSIQMHGQGGTIAGIGGAGIRLEGGQLLTSTGSISLFGSGGPGGPGVEIVGVAGVLGQASSAPSLIQTGSGGISISGVGTETGGETLTPVGVVIAGATVGVAAGATIETTNGGNIDISGFGSTDLVASGGANGVRLGPLATVRTAGAPGNIRIRGQALQVGSAGLLVDPTATIGGTSTTGDILLGAAAPLDTDAIVLSSNGASATVRTSGVILLRPASVSATGVPSERGFESIDLGGPLRPFVNFNLSQDDLNALASGARAVIIGGGSQTGAITVLGPVVFRDNVTLQNTGLLFDGGPIPANGVFIDSPLSSPGNTVALISTGTIQQKSPISAKQLALASLFGGDLLFTNPGNNVTIVSVLAGQGRASFVNSTGLTLGPVAATLLDSGTNSPVSTTLSDSISFGDFFAQTLAGNLTLTQNISTLHSNIDLVTADVFNNAGNGILSPGGSGVFRIWADTWVGENRGGLVAGSTYGCTYPGGCVAGVSVPGGNRFIYRQQPLLTVTADNLTKVAGFPNPPLRSSTIGLVNGDRQADALIGAFTTTATQLSPIGIYPITGAISSPIGYRVSVVDGFLRVTGVPADGRSDPLKEPSSAIYDRNLGRAPICLAAGPLTVERTLQGPDMLALEWSRVRLRPNLSNCVELGERNGCQDF